jgi:hypothetical protein
MEFIRWGILGCGRIARKFAADLHWLRMQGCLLLEPAIWNMPGNLLMNFRHPMFMAAMRPWFRIPTWT